MPLIAHGCLSTRRTRRYPATKKQRVRKIPHGKPTRKCSLISGRSCRIDDCRDYLQDPYRQSQQVPCLRELNLAYNMLGDDGVEGLSRGLIGHPSLEILVRQTAVLSRFSHAFALRALLNIISEEPRCAEFKRTKLALRYPRLQPQSDRI